MKKYFWLLAAGIFLFQLNVFAQTSPPPLYEEQGEEELPVDLSVEKLPQKKKPPPAEPQPPIEATQPDVKPAEPAQKIQVEPKEAVQLPSPTPAPAAPPPPPITPVETKPEIKVPANVPVIEVKPLEATPAQQESAPLQDGGPLKDAGNEPATALTVTYSLYETNLLAPNDPIDTFKIYTRPQEGIGVILIPKNPASQLTCDLLGEQGEVLSQTQAPAPGQPLSFQTSPFDKNGVLYLQVRDLALSVAAPDAEPREYSLELKPIAVVAPPLPVLSPPQEAEKPAPPETKEEPAFQLPENFQLYAIIGGAVLILLIVLLVWIRRRRNKDENL